MIEKIRNIAIIFIICFQVSYSQVEYFNRIHSHHIASVPYAVIEKDSAYYVGGTFMDTINGNVYSRVFMEKFSRTGDLIWTKSWGNYPEFWIIGWLSPMIETSDGGFATIGGINDTSGIWHGVLMKHDSNGDTLWMKHFYDTISAYNSDFLALRNIKETYDKGFIIVGKIKASHQYDSDIFMIKLDSLGNTEWYKTYGHTLTIEEGHSVIQTPDTGYFIGGYQYRAGMAYSGDAHLIKTDKYGNELWQKQVGGNYMDRKAYVSLSTDSNYVVAFSDAYQEIYIGSPDREINVFKITPSRQILWMKKYRGHENHYVNSIHPLDDGSSIIAGYSFVGGGYGGFIMKVSNNGDSLWYRDVYYKSQFTYDDHDYIYDIKPTSDGGYIACGEYKNYSLPFPQSTWLLKVDSMGCDSPGCFTVGIKDPKELWNVNPVSVYPNPAYDYLNFEINQPFNGILHFELFDSYGQLVKQYKITRYSIRISLANINNGMYFYRVRSKDSILAKDKLLVIR